jgi:hypothetical protein
LYPTKSDVLVMFDCCDSGYLRNLRAPGAAFEYLVACEAGNFTLGPSERSFTAAITWALEELSTGPPFKSKQLRDRITKCRHFPTKQNPILFARFDLPEPIWISRMNINKSPTTTGRVSTGEFRDHNCEYVDIRLFFNRHLTPPDAKHVAEMRKPLLQSRQSILNARHVSFLDKSTCDPKLSSANSPNDHWRKAKLLLLLRPLA